jgi:hypothetical protein
MNDLPAELWERILSDAGPLGLCCLVRGACARRAAAQRIQRWVRAHAGRQGDAVQARVAGGAWERGTLQHVGALWFVRSVCGPKCRILFLEHPLLRVRRASDGAAVLFVFPRRA